MALTEEQLKEIRAKYNIQPPDQPSASDRINKWREASGFTSRIQTEREEAEQRSVEENRPTFPAVTGEGPLQAGLKSAGNIPSSAINLARNIGQAASKPVQTVKGLLNVAKGAGERAGREILESTTDRQLPQASQEEEAFNSVLQSLKDRYGSLEALQRTATNDPLGFGSDVAGIVTGAGTITKGALGKSGRIVPQTVREAGAGRVAQSAADDITEILAPTTRENKLITQRVRGELLDRNVIPFSRKGLSNKVAKELEDIGQKIDETLDSMPDDVIVEIKPIVDQMEDIKGRFVVDGVIVDDDAFRAVSKIQEKVAEFGDEVDFASLRRTRQILDDIAKRKGAFNATAAEKTQSKITKEALRAIRKELGKKNPDLAALNSEYSFWKDVEQVIDATITRKTGQSGGLGKKIGRGAGGVVGGQVAGVEGAIIGQEAGARLASLFNSTAWKSVKARTKRKIAQAIIDGDSELVEQLIAGIAISDDVPTDEQQ